MNHDRIFQADPLYGDRIGEFSSVGLGVMMIVLSLFCRYGAERNEGKPDVCKDQSK